MKCYNCGKEIDEDVRICPFCHAVQGVETDLVESAKSGNQSAFTELYHRSYNNVYYTVKSMIKDEDTVQDIVQDTYIQVYNKLTTLQDGAKFQAWARRIAHNQALDYIKRRKPILFSEMTDADAEENEPVLVDENLDHMPEEVVDRQETTRLIQEILDDLNEEQRMAVGMFYYEQYSVREIAEMLGVSENTVKSRLKYGRDKIEKKVLSLEKKGTKLYGLAPIPFLLFLFRSQSAQAASISNVATLQAILTSTGLAEQGGEAAKAVAAAAKAEDATGKSGILLKSGGTFTKTVGVAGKSLAAKIAAGVVVAGILGGTIFYAATRPGEETETVAIETQTEAQTETQTEYVAAMGSGVMKLISVTEEDLQNVDDLSVWENTSLKRSEIESISFLTSGENIPQAEDVLAEGGSTATVPWDISENGDGSVIAWATDADGNGLYDLYIAGTGEIHVNTEGSYLFAYYTNLKKIEFGADFDTSLTKSMAAMFEGCEALEELNLSAFDTANVTNMSSMFAGCESLQALDVSGFDTANVTTMSSMFAGCESLQILDISRLDTASLTIMSSMFAGCESLQMLDVSGLDTANVTTMSSMFAGCESLQILDVSGFDTSNVTDMSEMFADCTGLMELVFLNTRSFNTSSVTNMNEMFRCCTSLTVLDLSVFQTSGVTTMSGMFQGCAALRELDIASFDTGSVTDFSYMFESCGALASLDVTHFQTSAATDMSGMFSGCSGLVSLDLGNFDTSNVRNMGSMFYACTSLKSLEISSFDTANVVDMMHMFAGLDVTLQEQLKTVAENFHTEKANLNGWFDALE